MRSGLSLGGRSRSGAQVTSWISSENHRSHSSLQAHRANPLDHAQDGQGAGSPRQQFWTKISTVSVVPTIRSTVSLTAFSSRGEVAGSRDWPNRSRSSFISGLRGYPQSLEQPAPRMWTLESGIVLWL